MQFINYKKEFLKRSSFLASRQIFLTTLSKSVLPRIPFPRATVSIVSNQRPHSQLVKFGNSLPKIRSFPFVGRAPVSFTRNAPCFQRFYSSLTREEKEEQRKVEIKEKKLLSKIRHFPRNLYQTISHGLMHYWTGTKLLGKDVRLASRFFGQLCLGKTLTRRERKLLRRVVVDLLRLVPFSFFIIVPFMELLLPVAVRIFPNMLPTTFHVASDKERSLERRLKIRLEIAKFLQETFQELAQTLEGERGTQDAKHFREFMDKVRDGEYVSTREIMEWGTFFNDELTLDHLPRPQLVAMCKYMGLTPYGTDAFLRFQLRMTIRNIQADDKDLLYEGVSDLTENELKIANAARGMSTDKPEYGLRRQLAEWLELSRAGLPTSLLVLSRAFTITIKDTPTTPALVREVLSSLPSDIVDEIEINAPVAKATVLADRAERLERKLDSIRAEMDMIEEEKAARSETLAQNKEFIAQLTQEGDASPTAPATVVPNPFHEEQETFDQLKAQWNALRLYLSSPVNTEQANEKIRPNKAVARLAAKVEALLSKTETELTRIATTSPTDQPSEECEPVPCACNAAACPFSLDDPAILSTDEHDPPEHPHHYTHSSPFHPPLESTKGDQHYDLCGELPVVNGVSEPCDVTVSDRDGIPNPTASSAGADGTPPRSRPRPQCARPRKPFTSSRVPTAEFLRHFGPTEAGPNALSDSESRLLALMGDPEGEGVVDLNLLKERANEAIAFGRQMSSASEGSGGESNSKEEGGDR